MTKRVPLYLRQLLEEANLTVTAGAKRLGISRPAFSNVVNGRADLSIELAFKLERRFGVPARWLLIEQLDEAIEQVGKRKRK